MGVTRNNENNKDVDQLFDAILSLRSREECYAFFGDLCTVKERQSLALRLEIARLLINGSTYLEIIDETNRSSAIVSRVKNCLLYGNGGFQTVLNRIAGPDQ